MAKLSDREKAAKKAGVAVNYSKSASLQKPIAPVKLALPKSLASKTPAAKLMTAQKSQPMFKPLAKGQYGPAAPTDYGRFKNAEANYNTAIKNISDMQRQSAILSQVRSTGEKQLNLKKAQDEEKDANERAKTPVRSMVKNAYNTVKSGAKNFIAPSTSKYSFDEIQKSNPTLKERVVGTMKGVGSVATQIARTAQLPGKGIGYLNRKFGLDTAERIRKQKEEAQDTAISKVEEKTIASTPGEAKFSGGFEVLSNFSPAGIMGKTGMLSKATGRVVNNAIKKGVSSKTVAKIIELGGRDTFSSLGKNVADNATLRAGDNLGPKTAKAAEANMPYQESNIARMDIGEPSGTRVPNTPENAPQSPRVVKDGIPNRPPQTPDEVPRTRAELPKRNTGRAEELFEETDDLGNSKVYANESDGKGGLVKRQVGEWVDGVFTRTKGDDGRDVADVLSENQKNLREGKRVSIKDQNSGDARAAIRNMRKPGMLRGGRKLTSSADSKLYATSEDNVLRSENKSRIEKLKAQLANAENPDEYERISRLLDEEVSISKDWDKLNPAAKKAQQEIYNRDNPDLPGQIADEYQGTREAVFAAPKPEKKVGLLRRNTTRDTAGRYNGSEKSNKDPLLQEAGSGKYKSAEEFVKAQGEPLYHGTVAKFNEFAPGKMGLYGRGNYFYTGKEAATGHGEVVEAFVKPGKLASNANFDSALLEAKRQGYNATKKYERATEILKENGYIGIKDGDLVSVFDNADVKTKSQLTDIYNKAQGTNKKYIQGEGGKMKGSKPGMSENVGIVKEGKKIKEKILNEMADFTEYAADQKRGKKIEYVVDEIRTGKYKSAEEFRKAVSQSHLMDLSNPEKHNIGRAFAHYKDEPLTDISDVLRDKDRPGSYLSTMKYSNPVEYRAISSPGETIKIYRAVPENVGDEIRIGDYVALDKKYAQMHLDSVLEGEQATKGKIISMEVPKKDIIWGEADFTEWAYSPRELRDKYPTLDDLYNKAQGGKPMLAANATGAAGGFVNEEGEVDFSQYNAKNALIGVGAGVVGLRTSKAIIEGAAKAGKKGLLTAAREARLAKESVQAGSIGAGKTEAGSVLDSFLTQSRTPKIELKGKKVSPPTTQNPRVTPSWVSKAGTRIREIVQDNWVRVKNLQESVGKDINSKDLTPYQAETLMHGRTEARLDAVKEAVKGIDAEVVKIEKLDPQARKKIDLYLTAKHAPERNAIHGDGAAGMTNAEAESILKEIGDNKEIKAVAQKMKDLNDRTLEILRDSQVISDETFNTLRKSYKEHVPLQRVMDDMDMEEYLSGEGLDVRSSGIRRAVGSDREVSDILTNITANLEQAVVRGEKNRVNLATLKFARENKNLGIFEEFKPKAAGMSFDGKKPVFQKVDDPNVLTVMENGKPVNLRIKDEALATAFKAVGQEKLPPLFNFIGAFTRLYSGLATRFNPEFAFSNKLRDLQEMAAYMAAQKGVGFSGAVKTAGRDVVSMADVTAGILGKDTEGAKLYRQMIEDGGTTGGMALSTRKQIEVDLEDIRRMNRAGMLNARKAGTNVLRAIDSWNEVFENSTRLSAYKTALDKGMTRDQAAFMAKNATINFNKKGTGGGIINSLYMFSNASIQGTTKLLSAMKNPKVAAAVTASVSSAVWATNEWNDKVDPEWRDKVDKWDRESNLIVALPTAEGVKYMTIPVSWGLKPMKVMADYGYDAIKGKADQKTGFDVAQNVLGSVWNAYNPVGGSSIGSSLMPTIGDVPYDIATNTKWSGSMIRPESKEGVPESENFFNKKGVPSDKSGMFGMLRKGTQKLADLTGGNIQVNPASLKYAIDSYLSGAGRAVSGTIESIKAIGTGTELQTKDTPFVRRFMKEKTEEEVTKSQGYVKKDNFQESLKKLPRESQPEKIQEYITNLPSEQREGAAYGLMMEGFNTKGVSTSDKIIQGRPVYERIQSLYDQGNDEAADQMYESLNDVELEQYNSVRSSERAKRTTKLKELLNSDPKEAVKYVRSLREDQGDLLYENLTKKGNEEWLERYEKGKLEL